MARPRGPTPSTTLTATPALHGDRLYLPVSSLEEGVADEKYNCCTFRGSVISFDAHTGKRVWQTYLVDEPKLRGTSAKGIQSWGPSGIAIWSTPAIDERRGVLYVTTGDNYSTPTTGMSDSVIAMDLETGKIRWVYQATANDAWNTSCALPDRSNCPKENGPDYDFGAAAILATAHDGRQYVLAGQKSGAVYALDPDSGKLVLDQQGGPRRHSGRCVFRHGRARRPRLRADQRCVGRPLVRRAAKPGLYALKLADGTELWKAPIADSVCDGRGAQCAPGIGAAVTATDDLVFTGAGDGRLRIYAASSGRVLWEYDTMVETRTVGGGVARGGSMGGGAGPIVHNGLLIVPSGYGFAGRMPGNLLLVFGVD